MGKVISITRIHGPDDFIMGVIDEIAQYVDCMYFLFHRPLNKEVVKYALEHPKFGGAKNWDRGFNSQAQLNYVAKWADELEPEIVLEFDEDEIPPKRFGDELEAFRSQGDRLYMTFRCMWAWGSPDRIIINMPRLIYWWHMKAYKWFPGITDMGRTGLCFIKYYRRKIGFRCQYPLRHLAVMTETVREERRRRYPSKPMWWDGWEKVLVDYDPDITFTEWADKVRSYYPTEVRNET